MSDAPDGTAKKPRRGFARGLVVGMVLGGAAALTFTPRTGEEMRERLRETFVVARERVVGLMTGEAPYQD